MVWIDAFNNQFYETFEFCFSMIKKFLPLCLLIAIPIAIVITVYEERGKQNEK